MLKPKSNIKNIKNVLIFSALLYQGYAFSQVSMTMKPGYSPSAAEIEKVFALSPGESLRLEKMKINDGSDGSDGNNPLVSMELQKLEVTNDETELVVQTSDMVRVVKPTPRAYFSGKLDGEEKSFVFFVMDEKGENRSIIHRGDQIILNEVRPASNTRAYSESSRKIDQTADFIDREFSCEVDSQFISKNHTEDAEIFRKMIHNAVQENENLKAAPTGTARRADLIVETDYEYYQKFNNTTTATNYATDLFAYVSAKYKQEIGARFLIKQINIYNTPSDPWTKTTTSTMLNELQAYWNTSSKVSTPRHHVHLLSGKNAGGGIAYLNTLNVPSYAYGVSGNISGAFTPSNPQIIWDAVVIAHEIGHAFGSSHSHEFDKPYMGSSTGGAIDCCYSGSSGQCVTQLGGAGKLGVLPGINAITGGVTGQRNGTIMSYCHALSAGIGNIGFTFGDGHKYGVNSSRIPTVMQTSAQKFLPADSTTPTTPSTYALTVTKAGTGASTGTVSSSPAGVSCGTDCTESYAANTAVTLTAAASSGSSFTGWGGSCSGTTATCSVTMAEVRSVTANFAAAATNRLVTLTKAGTGSGTVANTTSAMNCGATCSGASVSFPTTSAVVLNASPATGSSFAGWSGFCAGISTPCTIPAGTASANVTATFNSTTSPTITLGESTGLSGTAGSSQNFWVQVPSGGRNLIITTSGGTGDVDLYVKAGSAPTTTSFDCSPYLQGNAEKCLLSSPKAGNYHILLHGATAYSGVALKATWTAGKAVQGDAGDDDGESSNVVQPWISGPAQ